MQCIVLFQKTSIPPTGFSLLYALPPPTPLEIPVLVYTFLSKFWLLKPTSSLKFPKAPLWVGIDQYFLVQHMTVSLVNHDNIFMLGWFTECSGCRLHANRAYFTPSVSGYVFETFIICCYCRTSVCDHLSSATSFQNTKSFPVKSLYLEPLVSNHLS